MRKMKRIFAVLLTAAMAVSIAACSNNNSTNTENNTASTVNSTSGDSDSQTDSQGNDNASTSYDPDQATVEKVEKLFNPEQLGPKSQNVIKILENKKMKFSIIIDIEEVKKETSDEESSASLNFSSMFSNIVFSLTKNGDESSRTVMNLGGLMNIDVLKNSSGTYMMNTAGKTATLIPDGSDGDETGGLGSSFNLDSMLDSENSDPAEITYVGNGEEEFKNKQYSFEEYKVKTKKSNDLSFIPEDGVSFTIDEESQEPEIEEITMKIYFDGNDAKYIYVPSESSIATITIDELTTDFDESELVVPDDYKIIESGSGLTDEDSSLFPSLDDDDSDDNVTL